MKELKVQEVYGLLFFHDYQDYTRFSSFRYDDLFHSISLLYKILLYSGPSEEIMLLQ